MLFFRREVLVTTKVLRQHDRLKIVYLSLRKRSEYENGKTMQTFNLQTCKKKWSVVPYLKVFFVFVHRCNLKSFRSQNTSL